jgi:hypothetical protein
MTIIYSLLPATAHLPLATMQAQDCSHLLTEDIHLPQLTCPCIIQARDSHQPTDAICQHLSVIDKSICQPSPPPSHLRSTYQHEIHLPLTTTSPLYATCGLYVCKALSYLCQHIINFYSVVAILWPCVDVFLCPPPHSFPSADLDTGNLRLMTPRQGRGSRASRSPYTTPAGDVTTCYFTYHELIPIF